MASFEISNILSAFNLNTVGSKVIDKKGLLQALSDALEGHDTSEDRAPGQHFVTLPEFAHDMVSAGVGLRTTNPNDYIIRMHRGQPGIFLKRSAAAEVEGLACVVYTREAYTSDPDMHDDPEELTRIEESDCTHVIVAVLAFAGPQAPLTPYRLVKNLAGGNKEVFTWGMEDVQEKAQASAEYYDKWCVVAD